MVELGTERKRKNEAMVYRRHDRTRSSWASFPALNDAWVSSFPAEFELYNLFQIKNPTYLLCVCGLKPGAHSDKQSLPHPHVEMWITYRRIHWELFAARFSPTSMIESRARPFADLT